MSDEAGIFKDSAALVRELEAKARELQGREARLRAILDTEPECVKIVDRDGRLVEMNPAGLAMLEVGSLAEAQELRLVDYLLPEYRAGFIQLHQQVLQGGSGRYEFEIEGRHGTRRWLETHAAPLRDAAGEITALLGITRDTTARKQAETQVRRLNRILALLSEINQALVRAPSPQRLFETVCRVAVEDGKFLLAWIGRLERESGRIALEAQAGASPETLALVEAMLRAECVEDRCRQTQQALATGAVAVSNDIERDPQAAHWRAAALERGYRSMVSLPLRVGGEVVGTFNLYAGEPGFFDAVELELMAQLAADISFGLEAYRREEQRRAAEAALRTSEERFRELAETIQEVFWVTDPDKNAILYVSPAYETIWGRPCASVYASPRSWMEAIHPEDRERVVRAAMTRQARGEYDEEYRIVRPDGEVRWLRERAFPVHAAGGRVERIVGVATDVTGRKLAEEEMRQAQKMESVGRLAAGIAHDFNNLLTVINGIAELAVADLPKGAALREDFARIREAGARAAVLTRQLLAFSRKQVLRPVVVDLNALASEAESLLRRVLGEDIRIEARLAPDLRPVLLDPAQFHQVILNLAVNSRDAMPNGGRLTIETRNLLVEAERERTHPGLRPGRYVTFTLADTGVGMDAATRQRLFEPFFTTKEPGRGTGLGLATVHGIVKQSGGEIHAESELGKGSSFTIYLPAVDQEAARDAASPAPQAARGAERVLVVDDDDGVRNLTRDLLARAGYSVVAAADAEEALRVLDSKREPIHLVLADVVMPGMSGGELAERIRRRFPRLPILLATGYADDAILRHGHDGVHLLNKPFSVRDLTAKVRQLLDS